METPADRRRCAPGCWTGWDWPRWPPGCSARCPAASERVVLARALAQQAPVLLLEAADQRTGPGPPGGRPGTGGRTAPRADADRAVRGARPNPGRAVRRPAAAAGRRPAAAAGAPASVLRDDVLTGPFGAGPARVTTPDGERVVTSRRRRQAVRPRWTPAGRRPTADRRHGPRRSAASAPPRRDRHPVHRPARRSSSMSRSALLWLHRSRRRRSSPRRAAAAAARYNVVDGLGLTAAVGAQVVSPAHQRAPVSGTRLRCGTRTYRRNRITDGVMITIEGAQQGTLRTSCTTPAFSPSTRHTARCRPTVVSGSYVTLSSSTRRTRASCLVRWQAPCAR